MTRILLSPLLRVNNVDGDISKIARYGGVFKSHIKKWLYEYIHSSYEEMFDIIKLSYEPVNVFDFNTFIEYIDYTRKIKYISLDNDRVKNYQECIIANWLFANNIAYRYSQVEEGLENSFYFQIKNTNIYIEYYEINEFDKARVGLGDKEYKATIQERIKLYEDREDIIIDIYHYDWTNNNIEKILHDRLAENNISINPKKPNEIIEILTKMKLLDFQVDKYKSCLQAIRFQDLNNKSIEELFNKHSVYNSKEYLKLLSKLKEQYIRELKKTKTIDYDNMILTATDYINKGAIPTSYKNNPKVILTVVGDDWQSIYRFAGSRLELITKFDKFFGSHTLTKLERTFRYNSSIAETAGKFIMQNENQFKKDIKANDIANESQVYLHDNYVDVETTDATAYRALQIISEIREKDEHGIIAILYRNNKTEKLIREVFDGFDLKDENVLYWTFHSSKGLEADYCIIVDLVDSPVGFPNYLQNPKVLDALLPELDNYKYSEERRLFYVAMTRAKKECHLIADIFSPSSFVVELVTQDYNLNIRSETFNKSEKTCPKCGRLLVIRKGKFKEFLGCSGWRPNNS
ncbi:topoisomerase DNA-binding C4 zinc finger domain-containing protein [Francisella noatunensis]|uniref:Topoisomerase DNA-binding C4 zinc finger domain-containing protein n=2 Tax=Francisella noatunensis TaxID=657445 RepID=A0A9Q2KR06_9GAMM|nr:3'-5' exonuclease [Francisella noatunensis]MBK2029395.1 topoisomerase DNA-binding C4 zinc finger domain-containing protein [Francisella noatunensis]MBK2034011.1 topoisomerase DNA-binding C4 zinc finger domain-containing protein [Francisella noatunensis]MBK2049424.1 topoisomerase DNA-binding C4 zinc finger domain-containing protein [Francisella noatunensis]MBK2052300.1 topoisomerase DNA-binding C4 zinc finger domain-containing protein [Francisella noatunensis]MBK2053739.1 topoisomerase DNA-b